MTISHKRILFGGLCSCAVALGLGRFAFTPILPLMQTAHGLDTQHASWLAAANNLGYLVGAVWAGMVRSDAGRHRVLDWGLALVAASLAAMALTTSEPLWNLVRLVAGIASAWVFVLASAVVVQRLAELGLGRLAGFHFSGVGLGIALSGSLIAWVGSWGGDDGAWVAAGLVTAVLSANAWWVLRQMHSRVGGGAARLPPAVPFSLPWLAAAYGCAGFGYIITGTFLVVVVKGTPGLDSYANLSWVAVGLAAMPSAAAWAWMAEHKGYPLALGAAHFLNALGCALLALVPHPAAVLLAAVMYGGTFLGIAGMSMSFGRAITPENPAKTMGLLTAVFSVGQILGPVAAAWVQARGGWSPALLLAGGVMLAGVPMLWAGGLSRGGTCASA